MSKRSDGFKVEESQRQSWLSIAAVWAGGMICVPSLMVGGVLVGGGLSMAEIVLSILIGYGLICAYMIFIGMQACDTGLPVAVMASGALGEKGARYIISALLAIACIGWFGIQSATCGSAFARMICSMLGMKASPVFISASSIIWGLIMLATACFGFKGLKWLNYIAVPLLVIVCLYGLIAGIVTNDGGAVIAGYNPGKSSGMVFGISMVVASFALGGVISADYCRFAKSRGDVVKSSIVGVLPAGLFMLITGALMSIVTGRSDISAILASLGVPFIGLVALVLATWTTNVTNAYSGGLALSNLLGFDEGRFKVTTGIAGGIGTLLAAFGLLNVFESFLSLMSALIPALAGVLIASYWVVGAGRRENFHVRSGFSWTGIVSYVVGAPTVLAEKAVGGTEYQKLFDMVSDFFGKKIYAFMPIEAGGCPHEHADGRRRRHGSRVPRTADGHVHHWRREVNAHGSCRREGQQLHLRDDHEQVDRRTGPFRDDELRRFGVRFALSDEREADEGIRRPRYRDEKRETRPCHPHGQGQRRPDAGGALPGNDGRLQALQGQDFRRSARDTRRFQLRQGRARRNRRVQGSSGLRRIPEREPRRCG